MTGIKELLISGIRILAILATAEPDKVMSIFFGSMLILNLTIFNIGASSVDGVPG